MRACSLSDLPEEGAVRVVLEGTAVCIARSMGEVFAISDVCSHADVSLAEGDVEDGTVECWLHGSRFDLRTGRPPGCPRRSLSPPTPSRSRATTSSYDCTQRQWRSNDGHA